MSNLYGFPIPLNVVEIDRDGRAESHTHFGDQFELGVAARRVLELLVVRPNRFDGLVLGGVVLDFCIRWDVGQWDALVEVRLDGFDDLTEAEEPLENPEGPVERDRRDVRLLLSPVLERDEVAPTEIVEVGKAVFLCPVFEYAECRPMRALRCGPELVASVLEVQLNRSLRFDRFEGVAH